MSLPLPLYLPLSTVHLSLFLSPSLSGTVTCVTRLSVMPRKSEALRECGRRAGEKGFYVNLALARLLHYLQSRHI